LVERETESKAVLRNILAEFFAKPDEEMLKDVLGEGRADAVLYALKHGEDLFHDPLTRVYDRRLLEGIWQSHLARAKRYEDAFTLILGDLNDLKLINDKEGYPEGDIALQAFASAMLKSARENLDTVIRYGGDEFLIFLSGTDSTGARQFLDRLIQKIPKGISASFGIAQWKIDKSFNELFEEANSELHEEKKNKGVGRDQHKH